MSVLFNPESQCRVSLRARHLVGRSRACDLRLQDTSVSGEHATIWWSEEKWWVRDLGSSNGTSVDGKVLQRGGDDLPASTRQVGIR